MDDRSRIAYLEAHPDERKDTAAAFLTRAIAWFAEHGITVLRVLTDNGSCYRSRDVAKALHDANVTHKRTRPYRPQTNGKVELFNRTLKEELACARPFTSNQQRLDDLDRFVHDYNHHRGHYAHHGGTYMSLVNNVPTKHSYRPAAAARAAATSWLRAATPP